MNNSFNNRQGGPRDRKDTRPNLDPYKALNLSDADREVGRKFPMIGQMVSALANKIMDKQKQSDFKKWISGDKFAALPDEAKGLAQKLQRVIDERSESLASAARVEVRANAGAAPRSPGFGARPPTRAVTSNASGADPTILGEPFHNPYTFVPFPPADWFQGVRARRKPTPLSMDEVDLERFTGVVELQIRTLSPLLTCLPDGDGPKDGGHKTYRALTIGNDVIVPATGVRGSLRTLMTVLAGGTLGYLDENVWLVQGRDLPLGPKGKASPPSVPSLCFLAEVVRAGSEMRAGVLKLGKTRLIALERLEALAPSQKDLQGKRPEAGKKIEHLWVSDADDSISTRRDEKHRWKVKLSGRPINSKGKREGVFLDDGAEITVPPALWRSFLGRHRHANHSELKPGDLVWLEPENPGTAAITSAEDIASIQWARWGRRGEQLLSVIRSNHRHMLPDCLNPDGLVDEVTDLFGQVPLDESAAGPFAARVRPENLVFSDAAVAGLLRSVPLAPLQPPHPGCAAFYRADRDPDAVANSGALRGFKVYRTTSERGETPPWSFSSQGVYGKSGELENPAQKVNKNCDLLKEGCTGTLRLACRSLSRRELGLLLLACSVDWRLGGGKPLGLGLCRPERVVVRDENGQELVRMEHPGTGPAALPAPYGAAVQDLLSRVHLWHASQQPVARLRYPRAVDSNRNRIQRGGHVWFQRHATPRKSQNGSDERPEGLEVRWVGGELQEKAGGVDHLRSQPLPVLDSSGAQGDVLYGYDLYAGEGPEWVDIARDRRSYHQKLEPFDPKTHVTGNEQSGGFHGQNQERRQDERDHARR